MLHRGTKIRSGFTLIELLIVVSIMSILLGVGSPVLFKASKIFRFRNDVVVIKGMMDEMRSAALNLRSIPEAATATPAPLTDCSVGFDTNYDDVCGDTIPFYYVFDIVNPVNGSMTLRTYADFTEGQVLYNSTYDILLDQKLIPSGYVTAYNGVFLLPITQFYLTNATPSNNTFSFAFQPITGNLEISYFNNNAPPRSVNNVTISVLNTALDKTYQLIVDRISGVPVELPQ